jgi:hypothetical protein
MKRIVDREFRARCGLEAAWDHLSAIEKWPSWAKHITSVERTPAGALAADTKGLIRLSNGFRSTFAMTEFDRPRHWKWVGPFLGSRIHYDHLFEAISAGETRIRFTLDAEGWTVPLVGWLFGAIYRRNLERAIPLLVEELGGHGPLDPA